MVPIQLYLCGGGFHAFWYHIGYVLSLRSSTDRRIVCTGSSAGALAAWTLAHRDVTKERLVRIARALVSTTVYTLDAWVRRFTAAITIDCGPSFDQRLYGGAYVTTPCDRTPVCIRTATPTLDVRASCFIPIVNGKAWTFNGYWDGSLGRFPQLRKDVRIVDCGKLPWNCLFPLYVHVAQYDRGALDARGFRLPTQSSL